MKHQSTYDTIAPFLFIRNPGYILKKELLKLPVFGIYASRVGIPIDRAGGTKTMKLMLAAARKGAEAGQQIVIFPEGTRQLPDTPADIKPGVIFMYNELGIPCVPVALNTGLCWQGSGFLRKPGHVVFEVLPPIEPDHLLPKLQAGKMIVLRAEALDLLRLAAERLGEQHAAD